MSTKGEFQHWFDFGCFGEREVTVKWDGYKPVRRAADDYDEMTIEVVLVADGKTLDITSMLAETTLDDLKIEAWEHFREYGAEAAEAEWDRQREERLTECNA